MSIQSVFAAEDISSLIRGGLKIRGLSARRLAEATRIHPAYISRVLKGRTHFSQDQLFAIGQALSLSGDENQYLRLLGQYEASGTEALRRTLKEQMHQLQLQHLNVARRLDNGEMLVVDDHDASSASRLNSYYGSVLTAKIHMLLTMKRFQRGPAAIAPALGITKRRLNAELFTLERLGLINRAGTKTRVMSSSIHLDESHPLVRQNHTNWRLDAIQHLTLQADTTPKPDELHLSVAFTASPSLKAAARKKFQEFVVWLKSEVDADAKAGREEELGVLLFDLY